MDIPIAGIPDENFKIIFGKLDSISIPPSTIVFLIHEAQKSIW